MTKQEQLKKCTYLYSNEYDYDDRDIDIEKIEQISNTRF